MTAIIDVQNLTKTYSDGTQAVKGISFDVQEGEFFGFLGPNGAGKSTTIKTLITLLRPTSGTVTIMGMDVAKQPDAIRRRIGYAAQEVGVDDDLNARENLYTQGELYHLDRATIRSRADELLELMDLKDDANRQAGSFSGGMRKRLDLATALMHRPRLIFLDEPTTGLDPQNRANLWVYLERLNTQEKMTIFLTTHYMEEADQLCKRLAIIDHGKIETIGSPKQLKDDLGGDIITLRIEAAGSEQGNVLEKAAEIAKSVPHVASTHINAQDLLVYASNGSSVVPEMLRALDQHQLRVSQLSLASPSLNDVFLKHTGTRIRDEAPDQNWRNRRGPFASTMRRRM